MTAANADPGANENRSTSDLVELTLSGHEAASTALVERFTPMLLGFLRARVPMAYEDVYQETFALALARLGTLRDRERFGPWLLTIARRAIADWADADARRSASRQRERVAGEVERWGGKAAAADSTVAATEQAQIVIDTILAMPEPYNLIVYLSVIHEKEPTVIASELGLRPGTVRMQLKRGLAKLRKSLERYNL